MKTLYDCKSEKNYVIQLDVDGVILRTEPIPLSKLSEVLDKLTREGVTEATVISQA
jgi:hypothetical protein